VSKRTRAQFVRVTFSRWNSLKRGVAPMKKGGVPNGTDGVPELSELASELLLAGERRPRPPYVTSRGTLRRYPPPLPALARPASQKTLGYRLFVGFF